jgi:hypothetical protein
VTPAATSSDVPGLQGPALFARAVAIYNAAFCKVVRRKLNVNSVAGQNSDPVTAHAPGNMSEDDMAVVKFDRKCRTWEDLFDAADYLDRTLFYVLRSGGFRLTLISFSDSSAGGYRNTP